MAEAEIAYAYYCDQPPNWELFAWVAPKWTPLVSVLQIHFHWVPILTQICFCGLLRMITILHSRREREEEKVAGNIQNNIQNNIWKGCEPTSLLDQHLVTFFPSSTGYLSVWRPGRAAGNCYYVVSDSPAKLFGSVQNTPPSSFCFSLSFFHLDILLSAVIKSFAIKNLNFFVCLPFPPILSPCGVR